RPDRHRAITSPAALGLAADRLGLKEWNVDSIVAIRKTHYAFLTLPNYSLIALANAIEPLRMANLLTGQNAYECSIVTLDGQPVLASNGLQLTPTVALDQLSRVDIY